MKPLPVLAAVALAALVLPAAAAGTEPMNRGAMRATEPLADGVVKKVDQAAGTVTLAHGPLPNGMPPMTMVFRLREPRWAAQLKPGQKIRFAVGEVNGDLTVLRFEGVQ